MKNIFFRNTAPVIPTGAKRSGGISRLTHNATIKAGAHVSRFLGKLGMTVVLLSPVVLSAQPGVKITGLAVEAGTVTLDVRWEPLAPPTAWSDTVWVFVDHNEGGTMKRLPLTGATLTNPSAAATATVPLPNNKGAWVAGNARIAGSFSAKVKLYYDSQTAVAGACAYASNYPPVAEYVAGASAMSFTGTPMYKIVLRPASGDTFTAYSDGLYTIHAGDTIKSFSDKTGAPGIIPGTNQPQGSCTFTQPAVVGTFASFPSNYSASTFVTLTDERDGKNYTVVKIGGRWIMAQNLNYQGVAGTSSSLTWQANSNQPSGTSGGQVTDLIGHFWCPGTSGASFSNLASCDVWGALYSWETAMMVDGKWTSASHSSSAWSEPTYGTNTSTGNTQNHGRRDDGATTFGGRGICPPDWHVPTDGEWGDILNAMESSSSNQSHNTGTGYRGSNAGSRAKAKCTCTSGTCADDEDNTSWTYNSSNTGTDNIGFRVLPSGNRTFIGITYNYRGNCTYFWSSSAYSEIAALSRIVYYNTPTVYRDYAMRSFGFSVRCIRD